jgi:LysM repeat protein
MKMYMIRTTLILFLAGLCLITHSQTVKPEVTLLRQQGTNFFFWYSFKKTDSKEYLAKRYHVSVDTLVKYNTGVVWENLKEKTLIKIPVVTSNFSSTKKSTATDTMIALYRSVTVNDNLSGISLSHYKVPIENIKIWNNLKDDKIFVGTDLIVGYIKRKRISSSVTTTTPLTKTTIPAVTTAKKEATVKKEKAAAPRVDPLSAKAKIDTFVTAPKVDNVIKKDSAVVLKPALPTDSLIIKQLPDSAVKEKTTDAPFIKKAPLARNRVNFVIKLSYLNSSFSGSDALANTFLVKNGQDFDLRDVGGKKRINAFSGGLAVENKIGMRLSLQTEILYERKGGDITVDSAQTIAERLNGDMRVRLNYLSFALLPKLNFGKRTVFYMYAGVYGGFLMRSVIEGEATLKNTGGFSSVSINNINSRRFNKADLGYATGLGLKFPYKKTNRQHLILEGRYAQSFNTVSNEDRNGKIPQILNRAFYVTVAYEFNR